MLIPGNLFSFKRCYDFLKGKTIGLWLYIVEWEDVETTNVISVDRSVAGPVIKAYGRLEFEDVLDLQDW